MTSFSLFIDVVIFVVGGSSTFVRHRRRRRFEVLLTAGLLPWSVLVAGIFATVQHAQTFRFFDERLSVCVTEQFPAATKLLADFRIVHVWLHFRDLPSLNLRTINTTAKSPPSDDTVCSAKQLSHRKFTRGRFFHKIPTSNHTTVYNASYWDFQGHQICVKM